MKNYIDIFATMKKCLRQNGYATTISYSSYIVEQLIKKFINSKV